MLPTPIFVMGATVFEADEAGRYTVGSFGGLYDYDPTSGKYGFAITTALKIGAVMTMLGVGGFVLVSRLRERKSHRMAA